MSPNLDKMRRLVKQSLRVCKIRWQLNRLQLGLRWWTKKKPFYNILRNASRLKMIKMKRWMKEDLVLVVLYVAVRKGSVCLVNRPPWTHRMLAKTVCPQSDISLSCGQELEDGPWISMCLCYKGSQLWPRKHPFLWSSSSLLWNTLTNFTWLDDYGASKG